MIVAVPNPAPSQDIEEMIQEALRSAEAKQVTGAQVTPYVLAMVKELTGGCGCGSTLTEGGNNY